MQQIGTDRSEAVISKLFEMVRDALEQAAIQMAQCARLLDDDTEFEKALEQVKCALSLFVSTEGGAVPENAAGSKQ